MRRYAKVDRVQYVDHYGLEAQTDNLPEQDWNVEPLSHHKIQIRLMSEACVAPWRIDTDIRAD